MNVPADLRYTSDHEWARTDNTGIRIGITDYAQDALGDVVFVQLPTEGDRVEAGKTMGEVESTKSVSDLYAPVSGVIAQVNSELTDSPQRLNDDPYGEGWICVITPDDTSAVDALMDASTYQSVISD